MDPLSDVLALVKPRSYGSGRLTAAGRWALDFAPHAGIKCYVVVKGRCLVVLDGVAAPVALATGDCLMLPHGRAFRLCSDLATRAVDARTLFAGVAVAPHNRLHAGAPGDDLFSSAATSRSRATPRCSSASCRRSSICIASRTRRRCAAASSASCRS